LATILHQRHLTKNPENPLESFETQGDFCNSISHSNSRELELKVISEYQDAFDEAAVTWKDLAVDSGKNAAYTGISFIPIIGPVISTIASAADPVVSFFRERGQQKALPVFLNDLKKFKTG